MIQQKALMLLYENKFTEAIKLYEQIKDEDNLILRMVDWLDIIVILVNMTRQ